MRLIILTVVLCAATHGQETAPGWQYGKTVAECNRYMLDHQLTTDVSFQVGPLDGARSLIRAHKYVLMSRSAVFEAMLFRHQKQLEVQNKTVVVDGDANIRIVDMDPGVFKEMLNFIYTDNATVSLKTVLPLMYAGKKYQLPKLIGECQRVLQTNISMDNVCVILDQAIHFEEEKLINQSVVYIGKYAETVLKSAAFSALSKEGLRRVASFDGLQINETVLYYACVKWAKHQLMNASEKIENATDSVIRQTLGEVLYKIRFPSMSLGEFATLSGKSDVLTCDEKSSIYYYIGTNDDAGSMLKFDRKPRCSEQMLSRYVSTGVQNWGCQGRPDAVQFQTDKDVFLTAIGSYGPANQWGQIVTSMGTIVDIFRIDGFYTNGQRMRTRIGGAASFEANYSNFTNGYQILKIMLDEKVEIKADIQYMVKLSIQQSGHNACYRAYGNSGQTRIVSSSPAVTFTFSAASISEGTQTSVETGQIPHLYYSCA